MAKEIEAMSDVELKRVAEAGDIGAEDSGDKLQDTA